MSKSMQALINEYISSASDAIELILTARDELMKFDDTGADEEDRKTLTEFAGFAAYQGFDPKMVAFTILKKRNEDITTRRLDIEKMIIIAIERGNNLVSIRKNSTQQFLTEANRIISTYDIKAKAASSRSNITFSRVAMAFPDVACSYMSYAKSTTVPKQMMNSISSSYPPHMMTSAFGSMIPNSSARFKDQEILKQAYYIHQYEFTKIVSQKESTPHSSMIADVIKYTDAATKGAVLKDEAKLELLVGWGILFRKGSQFVVANDVKNAAKIWMEDYVKRQD